ncbi:MAG: CoA-binding protein [Methylovirgula sp.]
MSTPPESTTDEFIRAILTEVKTIALVGLSADPTRPSHYVFDFLQRHGYKMVGVNPGLAGKEILGAPVYARLADIPFPVDMIDIFRNSAAAGLVVDEALALSPRPKVIWMQLDVRNDEAAQKAKAQGLKVVMNRCPKIEYRRLLENSHGRG